MIEIIGEGDHPTEALAAKLFYKLMVAEFPDIERNSDLHCSILMSVTCYKQVVQECPKWIVMWVFLGSN